MKKWLDKTWAKVTAFILLIVFTVLTVAGGVGIAYLVSENAYWDGGEELVGDYYAGVCQRQIGSVYEYLQGKYEVDSTAEQTAAGFENYFADGPCALCVYGPDGTLLFRNTPLDGDALHTEETIFFIPDTGDGASYRVTAALRPGYRPASSEKDLRIQLYQWRYGIIALTALCLALWIFCLSFTLASAGHWQGHEGIHLTWFDRIPVDLWLAGFVIFLGLADEWFLYFNAAAAALFLFLLYFFLPAFAAQCKAGTVLKGTVIAWVLRLLRRVVLWLGYMLARIPLVWKTALGVAALLLFDFFCVSLHWDEEFLFLLLLVNLLPGLFLLYLAIGLRKLQKGGQELAAGNYDNPVDTKYLFGDFRRHGQDLNAIQQGVQKAVAEQMRSERMKTELITNVSHDIKTPLTSIVNYVDLLKKEPIDNPTAREYIDVLDRQSNRLRKLTEDLVEASKAASGSIPVSLTDTDVNVFLSQVVGEYRQRLAESGVEPVLTADESEPHISADGKLLWRVLDNLMSNVCKYAMPGTRVYLSSEAVHDHVFITVKNVSRYPLNVSADELTERFVRGDASRSTEGSGLGLSIAMGLTRLQRGEFQLSVDGDLFKVQLVFPLINQ